jgi:protein-tyrosine phosphatase
MAAGVFRTLVHEAGMQDEFVIDSAGTFDGQVGQPASPLAIETAKLRGYDITAHRAKLLTVNLVKQFDLPIAMDRTHLAALRWMVPRERQDIPTLLMQFAPHLGLEEVPDPYGGPAAGYDKAMDLIEAACKGLIEGFQSEFKEARSG